MPNSKTTNTTYQACISRRESLKRLGAIIAGGAVGATQLLSSTAQATLLLEASPNSRWPNLQPSPINVKGYGKDPKLIVPPESPWPLTLNAEQLSLCSILADIVVPRDGDIPSASELNIPEVVDEWISAPYSTQQQDRTKILNLFAWLNIEAKHRFKEGFLQLNDAQQLRIVDNIAYPIDTIKPEFVQATEAFSRFKGIVLAAFFTSKEGMKDIGYMGNVPISGDYPGPSKEAKAHIDKVIADLGLSEYAYKA